MTALWQRQPASGVELWALWLRHVTVLTSAPFDRWDVYRRAEVAVDPVARIGLPARKFKSRNRRSFANTKLDAAIARRRRNRMPWVRTKPWARTKGQRK